MRRLIFTAAIVCATWAAASDMQMQARPTGTDGQLELAWDNGTLGLRNCWVTGSHMWLAVDFDISMIQSYRKIDAIRFYSWAWPNGTWEGCRVGLFAMNGSAPGSQLWGPSWAGGAGSGGMWVDAPLNDYYLPAGTTRFAAAIGQWYNYPNCDGWEHDTNPTFSNHTWIGQEGSFFLYPSYETYRNVMIRAVVDNATAVQPTSLGRVKAAYF
jgi:hypothetical protein